MRLGSIFKIMELVFFCKEFLCVIDFFCEINEFFFKNVIGIIEDEFGDLIMLVGFEGLIF